MKEDISSLVELQVIDRRISKVDDEIAGELAGLEKRKNRIEDKREVIQELEQKLETRESRRRELEAEVEDELARIKDRQSKLMNVQTNREYQSLLKEIEEGKKQNKQREEEVVALMEQVEELKGRLDEEKTVCETEAKLLDEEQAKVQKHTASLEGKKAEIVKLREEKAGAVSAPLLKRYELLRERRNGIALAGVNNGVCTGCNMNIPPQLFIELLKAEKLLTCPTCNRMMYHETEEEKA